MPLKKKETQQKNKTTTKPTQPIKSRIYSGQC